MLYLLKSASAVLDHYLAGTESSTILEFSTQGWAKQCPLQMPTKKTLGPISGGLGSDPCINQNEIGFSLKHVPYTVRPRTERPLAEQTSQLNRFQLGPNRFEVNTFFHMINVESL